MGRKTAFGSALAASLLVVSLLVVVAPASAAAFPQAGTSATEVRFPDVPEGHEFAAEIAWLVDRSIATGDEDGRFRPADGVSR